MAELGFQSRFLLPELCSLSATPLYLLPAMLTRTFIIITVNALWKDWFHSWHCPHVTVCITFTGSSVVLVGQMRCSSVLKEEWTYLRVFSLIKWQSGDVPWLSALITSRILKRHVGLLKLISVSPLNSFYFLSAFGLSHKPEIRAYCKASLL